MDTIKCVILSIVIFQDLSTFTRGAIRTILDDCCMTGSNWGSRGELCDSYPSMVAGVSNEDQRSCRTILEVCCIKGKQQTQCDNGQRDALQLQQCAIRSDIFGSEQYKECCHCCHLGLAQRSMHGDCDVLISNAFGGPCDRKFKECCEGSSQRNNTENDINECELYPNICHHDCVNTVGSYHCECHSGYTLQEDGINCQRTVETCAQRNPCHHECVDGRNGQHCQCNPGYQLQQDGIRCADINECELLRYFCPATTDCVNTVGSYRCQPREIQQNCSSGTRLDPVTRTCQPDPIDCNAGYAYNTVTRSCEDIDECIVNMDNCHGDHVICENTPGSFNCECDDGFALSNSTQTCEDIDECAARTDTCLATQRCENLEGSYSCRRILGCGTGYSMDSDTQQCVDVDECALNTHNCGNGYSCVNIQGSFRCNQNQCDQGYRFSVASGRCEPINCRRGFRADRRGLCRDINECQEMELNRCSRSERCVNLYGTYRCTSNLNCRSGYEAAPSGESCVDIDECTTGAHDCRSNQQCINRPGSFICNCQRGFRLNQSGACEDIDECQDNFVCPFNAQCENSPGSFRCTCSDGLRSQGRRCIDINECGDRNPCQHRCLNVYGSFHCQCNSGYELGADKRSCQDINECTKFGGRGRLCGGHCVNTIGSYSCSCPDGWTSIGSGRSCKDIDECREPGICGSSDDLVCFNTRGSYKCPQVVCPEGFVRTSLGPRRNSIRCRRVHFVCNRGDTECQNRPLSYSYNFLSFPTNVKVPADLFAMSGAESMYRYFQWELELDKVRPAHAGVMRINRGYFSLKENQGANEAIISLMHQIPGPQDIELRMTMMIYNRANNIYLGKAVSKIYLYVTDDKIATV